MLKTPWRQAGRRYQPRSPVITNDELQKLYADLPIAKLATPRAADSHPDLSGVWLNPFPAFAEKSENGTVSFDIGGARTSVRYPSPSEPSYKPEYGAKVKAIVDGQIGASTPLDPQYDCKPMGVPRASMNAIQIVQTPKLIVILYESNFIGQTFRIIYTDGRPHPKDLDSSFLGDSIGHWEGETLVVDVTGFNDETWLGGGQGRNHLHSAKSMAIRSSKISRSFTAIKNTSLNGTPVTAICSHTKPRWKTR